MEASDIMKLKKCYNIMKSSYNIEIKFDKWINSKTSYKNQNYSLSKKSTYLHKLSSASCLNNLT